MSEHPQPTTRQLVAQIAEALSETAPQPLEQIRRLITVMGAAFVHELLHETHAIEAAGGLFLHHENRRRTIGGVFFYRARKRMTKPQRGKVFAYPVTKPQRHNVSVNPIPREEPTVHRWICPKPCTS